MYKRLLFLSFVAISCFAVGQSLGQTMQRQLISGELPDPTVIKVGDIYYVSGSSNNWGPYYPIYESPDLQNWKFIGYVFDEKPDWTIDSYWAPELYYEDGTFYCYYTARRTDGISCIGVASTKDITKGFKDHGVVVEWENEAIDAYVYKENGTKYITWKAYGLNPDKPIQILGAALTQDGLRLDGEAFEILTAENDTWESGGIEGQCIIKHEGYLYMLYSGNACCGASCDYQVGVARAKSIKGPWEKNPVNPIMKSNETWKCPGHGTAVHTDQEWVYIYHAYHSHGFPYLGRSAMLSPFYWDQQTQWPYFELEDKHIDSVQLKENKTDKFEGKLAEWWRYDVSSYLPQFEISGSKLRLVDQPLLEGENKISALVTVPEYADFEIATAVLEVDNVMSGLVYYATDKNAVGYGVKDNTLTIWKLEDGEYSVLSEMAIDPSIKSIHLKSTSIDAQIFKFYYSTDNKNWMEMPLNEHVKADHLAWWSWGIKAGLFVKADKEAKKKFGTFDYFNIQYL